MFSTPSGQTGVTAYAFELAQIANLRRELDARMSRLVDNMTVELTPHATAQHVMSEKLTITMQKDTIVSIIDMARHADGFGFETLSGIVDTLELRCEDCIEAGCMGCKHV
jgi:hypothetical protein